MSPVGGSVGSITRIMQGIVEELQWGMSKGFSFEGNLWKTYNISSAMTEEFCRFQRT